MAEVKWIKVVTDIFEDEKLLVIDVMPKADSLMIIWFKLLCLAGKQNNGGVFKVGNMPYTADMFAAVFRRPVKTIKEALAMFEQFGMIETVNGVITIPNWDKHQSLDVYEKKKARDRLYQQERRNRQEIIAKKSSDNRLTTDDKSSDVVVSEEDKEERIRNYSILERVDNKSILKAPTLEEVKDYVKEIGSCIDPERFFNHYKANGWHIGKVPMEDWKAAVQKWTASEDKPWEGKKKKPKPSYDIDKIEKTIFKNGISEEEENESNKV